MTKAAIPDRVEAVVLPHVCWLMDSALYDECDDLCPTCARAVADAEPCAIVQGGDPARECDSPTTCERCGCCLSCTVGGVEIYTDEDWQNAAHDGRPEGYAMTTRKRAMSRPVDGLVRSPDYPERYPVECPNCGMVLHQSHAAIYGECLLCGAKVRPIRTPNDLSEGANDGN